MTTDAFRLHAHIVLHFYASIGTTKKILNLSYLQFGRTYNEYFAFK